MPKSNQINGMNDSLNKNKTMKYKNISTSLTIYVKLTITSRLTIKIKQNKRSN